MKSAAGFSSTRFSKGYAAILATIVIWSTPSLFLFYLNRYYDPYAQNFYRYSVACLAVLPFLFTRIGRTSQALTARAFVGCAIPAVPNVIHQISQVLAISSAVLLAGAFLAMQVKPQRTAVAAESI